MRVLSGNALVPSMLVLLFVKYKKKLAIHQISWSIRSNPEMSTVLKLWERYNGIATHEDRGSTHESFSLESLEFDAKSRIRHIQSQEGRMATISGTCRG